MIEVIKNEKTKRIRMINNLSIVLFYLFSIVLFMGITSPANAYRNMTAEEANQIAEQKKSESEECAARGGTMVPNGMDSICDLDKSVVGETSGYRDITAEEANAMATEVKSYRDDCLANGGRIEMVNMQAVCNMDPLSNCGYPEDIGSFINNVTSFCWYCGPFNKVVSVIQDVASATYARVESGMFSLMATCFALWMVLKIMKYIASTKLTNPGDFYTDIGSAAFKLLIGYLAIDMGTEIWDFIVGPLADGVFDYGSAAMSDVPKVDAKTEPLNIIGQKIIGDGITAGGVLALINQKLMTLIAMGWLMVSAAMETGQLCLPFHALSLFMVGLIFIFFGAGFLLWIPLMCADILFRFGIFLVLLPMFIFAWVFPITRSFTDKGINMLIYVMINLLLFTIMIAVCIKLIEIGLDLPNISEEGYELGLAKEKLFDDYVLSFGNFLKTIAYLSFSVIVLGQVGVISSQLSSIAEFNTGFDRSMVQSIRGTSSSAMTTAALAGVIAGKLGQRGARNVTEGTGASAENRANADKNEADNLVKTWQKQGGRDGYSSVNIPLDIAQKIEKAEAKGEKFKFKDGKDIERVLKANRSFIENTSAAVKEKLLSTVTGVKANKYYPKKPEKDEKK